MRAVNPSTPRAETDGSVFEVGSQIEARYHGKNKWYPGKLAKVNGDGTYDITYSDGDSERGVIAEYTRTANQSTLPDATNVPDERFTVGIQIEARYRGKKKWYAGAITKVNGDDTYDVRYSCMQSTATPSAV